MTWNVLKGCKTEIKPKSKDLDKQCRWGLHFSCLGSLPRNSVVRVTDCARNDLKCVEGLWNGNQTRKNWIKLNLLHFTCKLISSYSMTELYGPREHHAIQVKQCCTATRLATGLPSFLSCIRILTTWKSDLPGFRKLMQAWAGAYNMTSRFQAHDFW